MYYKSGDKQKEKILTLRANTDFIDKIDKLAKKLGMTRSKLIKKAIERALEDFKRESADDITRA
ncbi:MAG: ribbon-helix-helix protein, CopG family, partial [Thermodesulfobacteriota bacterium]